MPVYRYQGSKSMTKRDRENLRATEILADRGLLPELDMTEPPADEADAGASEVAGQ